MGVEVEKGPGWELRCGDYRTALANVTRVGAVIGDPPYGARTHGGQRHGRKEAGSRGSGKWVSTQGLEYEGWSPEDAATLVRSWAPRCDGWMFVMTSHDLVAGYQEGAAVEDLYSFAPVPCVMPGMNVRLAGDGPSSWAVYGVPIRPRSLKKWGTLPGAYYGSPGHGTERAENPVRGAKPLWLMRAIIRDYTRPGDLVCDPCAGGGTTLLAAVIEGRRAIGAEVDPHTFSKAVARLRRGYTPAFDFGDPNAA